MSLANWFTGTKGYAVMWALAFKYEQWFISTRWLNELSADKGGTSCIRIFEDNSLAQTPHTNTLMKRDYYTGILRFSLDDMFDFIENCQSTETKDQMIGFINTHCSYNPNTEYTPIIPHSDKLNLKSTFQLMGLKQRFIE